METQGGQPEICTFFRQGKCKYGSNCIKAHPKVPSPNMNPGRESGPKTKQLCLFNLTTGCHFGEKCEKEHREIQSEEEMGQVYEWMKKHNPDFAEQLMNSVQEMMEPEVPQPKSQPQQVQPQPPAPK